MGGIIGMITGSTARDAAQTQADATLKSANLQAAADRVTAQGAQEARETMIAQDLASKSASNLLSKPQDKLDVALAPDTPDATIDPNTGRRKTVRSSFMASPSSASGVLQGAPASGISI